MKRNFILIIFFCLSLSSLSQERSIRDLYDNTIEICGLINQAKHLRALDRVDEVLNKYDDFPGREFYFTYLYMYKAEAYLGLGDALLSEHCSSIAMTLAEESNNHAIQFTILNNLSVLEIERHNYQACFDMCRTLLCDTTLNPDMDQWGMVMNNMALSAVKLKDYKAADSLFTLLFELSRSNFNYQEFDPILPYRNYGLYLQQLGKDNEAHAFFHTALIKYRDSVGDSHYETGCSYLYLGECEQAMGDFDSARSSLDSAINILEPDSVVIRPATYELLLVKAYRARAYYWFSLSCTASDPSCGKYLQLARNDITKAMNRIDYMMQSYATSESGFRVAGLVRPVYNLAVEISMEIYRREHKMVNLEQALAYSDQSKELSLQSLYHTYWKTEISSDLEVALRSLYHIRQIMSDSQVSQNEIVALVNKHSMNKKRLDSMLGSSTYIAKRGMGENEISISRIARPLLCFNDLDSIFQVFYIGRRVTQIFNILKSKTLVSSIIRLKSILSVARTGNYNRAELDEFISLSSYLYEVLVKPIAEIERGLLFIQPDGELNGLPFGILLDMKDGEAQPDQYSSFRELPYFFLGHSIFYLSSIYREKYDEKLHHPILTFLTAEKDSTMSAVDSELAAIRKYFKGRVNENLDDESNILHFSGHAQIDLTNPYQSRLSNGLSWGNILEMDNRGRKVYLNACRTGLGLYNSGEGLMSLGLAFLLSGSKQVVETYWMAPEVQTVKIAEGFYKNGGFEKPAKALRKSKLSYLEQASSGLDHPHYWAGTIVRGQSGPIHHISYGLLMIITISVVVSVLFLFRHYYK